MEHPEVAYRLAVQHQLELERQLEFERAVVASRDRVPARWRIAAILGAMATRLIRRPASLSAPVRARPVPEGRAEADSPLFD